MTLKVTVGITHNCNSKKIPIWKFYITDDSGNILPGDMMYNVPVECNINIGIPEELRVVSTINIDDTKEREYTLVIEHIDAVYPDDYIEGDFGIDIAYIGLCDVDLRDLIHRRGHTYLDCTNNPYYTLEQINNNKFIANDFRLLNYRHNQIRGNNPRVFNNKTQETTEYNGYFVTDCGYIIIDNTMYYDATNDVNFIAENSDNENLFVKDDKLIHHIPNSSCLSLNGRWELKFKTPLYGWIVDNIFGNDFI